MVFKPKKRTELIMIFILAVIVAGIEIADLLEYSNVLLDQQEKVGMYFWSFCSIGVCILICGMVIRRWIADGKTIIMSKEGCTISFWHYQRTYKWQEFKIKALEDFSHTYRDRTETSYKKGVVFSTCDICKLWWRSPQQYSISHPFSFICIYFVPERKISGQYASYETEEELFMDKMKEWGIELEEISFYERRKEKRRK